MELTLYRLYEEDGTIGAIVDSTGNRICYTMENPWRNNQAWVSCIPVGDYRVEYLKRSASGKYHDCYYVTEVPGRSGILIHLGNKEEDTFGCILPGERTGYLGKDTAVLNSKGAMARLHMETGRGSFTLRVRDSLKLER